MHSNIMVQSKSDVKGKKTIFRVLKSWQLYCMLALPLIYLLIFSYYPMLGLQIAFREFRATKGIWGSDWTGLLYFNKFFSSYQFARVLKNTLIVSFYSLLAGFPIPIMLALCLNCVRNTVFKKAVQTLTYIPHFISTVVLCGMLIQMLNPICGLYGTLYQFLFGQRAIDVLGIPSSFIHLYVWSGVWQNMGWSSIIYVAALAGTDPQLHEAAQIDGASRFKRVLYIDLPSILPTATILLILRCGQIMGIGFEKVFLLQNNLNLTNSEVISTYVYKLAFGMGSTNFSYSTAVGMFNSVINLVLIVSINWVAKKMGETSLW